MAVFLDIVDRRKNPKDKSLVNRQRFLRRHRQEVRAAVREKIVEADVKDIASDAPKKLKVSSRGTDEPTFRHQDGGVTERVIPGNKEFQRGDKIKREAGGEGSGGSEGSPDGDGEDSFVFEVSQAEFLNYFFEGLELPDMVKRALEGEDQFRLQRAGYASDGTPSNLDPLRTMRHSRARRIAFRIPKQRRKRRLEEERDELVQSGLNSPVSDRIAQIEEEIRVLERQIKAIPFLDEVDLRYRRHERVSVPVTRAVMFCLMDVSGSMGEREKEVAKRFFMLLYLFLVRSYEKVEIVFIRHHHTAKEVDEEEFFSSRESGGTVVSTALALMQQVIAERYSPTHWNIYGCQASDGDNFQQDLPVAQQAMVEHILPLVQYYGYVEIGKRDSSPLWGVYEDIRNQHPILAMARIAEVKDIFPVFRGLFEKEGVPSHG